MSKEIQTQTEIPHGASPEDPRGPAGVSLEVLEEKTKRVKGRKKKTGFQFIIFFAELYGLKEWQELSAPAKIVYFHVKGRYTKKNNGEIVFPYSAMTGVKGCSTPNTVAKAVRELEEKGWIKITQTGGEFRVIYFYELTFKYDLFDGKHLDGKNKTDKPYVIFQRQLCHRKAWKGLAAASKVFYMCAKGRYRPWNNGKIELPYRDMKGVKGCSSRDAVSKAIKELEAKEWVVRTKIGGMYRFNNLYKLTFNVDLIDGGNINKSKYDK